VIKNYINGELREPVSEKYFDNFDPAIGEAYGIVPDSDERDVELAVAAAEAAFPGWANTPPEERSRIMFKITELINAIMAEFARAECIDNGKPLTLAKTVDIPKSN
jgi:aminomuconate-semialdehyde/2-hydroxymuconate-6-semialdehyde dehydrogenase